MALGCALVSLFASSTVNAADWPQFLGPTRDGIYAAPDISVKWPTDGPPVVWQKKVGDGFAGPAVAEGKLILFHRLENRETIECLNATNGEPVWKFDYPTLYKDEFGFDEGPRAVPTIAQGKVFTLGANGEFHCLSFSDGKKIWSLDVRKKFSADKGYFGLVCAPLVEGKAVIVNIGGQNGAGIVAFDIETGKVLWRATDEEASYSSPVAATIDGQRRIFCFARSGLVMLAPDTGEVLASHTWRSRSHASVNAAAPLVIGDRIFLSAAYETGAIVLELKGRKFEVIWSGDDQLSNHYATSVHRHGFLYGFHGRQEQGQVLRCIELTTGKVRWERAGLVAGTVTLAGETLLVMTEKGQLVQAAAQPNKFEELNSAQVLPFGVRAYPALADGRFYARSKDKLACIDLRGEK